MNIPDAIYSRAKILPLDLQREALDFIEYLEHRYVRVPTARPNLDTEAFLARFAGCLGDDFPDDIEELDQSLDALREPLE